MDGSIRIRRYREEAGYQDETDPIGFGAEATDGTMGQVTRAGTAADGPFHGGGLV